MLENKILARALESKQKWRLIAHFLEIQIILKCFKIHENDNSGIFFHTEQHQQQVSYIPLFRSAAGQRSFVHVSRVVCLWNVLPESLARIDSLPHFKAEVKKRF